MCDDGRNAPQLELRTCPMCDRTFPVQGRGVYCGPTCRQRAFRLCHRQANQPRLTRLIDRLRQTQRLIQQTVYECPSCTERFLGERRCGDCNRMCRNVGLGGECSSCAEILTIADLLGDLEGGALALTRDHQSGGTQISTAIYNSSKLLRARTEAGQPARRLADITARIPTKRIRELSHYLHR